MGLGTKSTLLNGKSGPKETPLPCTYQGHHGRERKREGERQREQAEENRPGLHAATSAVKLRRWWSRRLGSYNHGCGDVSRLRNQTKRGCSHRWCRTCGKSRGFGCTIHVKGTWAPTVRRQECQLMVAATPGAGSSRSTSGAEKSRLITSQTATTSHTSISNTTLPRSFDTNSDHRDASFKEALSGQVRAPAVFQCARVIAANDGHTWRWV